jgi:hypothetical protein
MKRTFVTISMLALSIPCFANECFDSPEYKKSSSIAQEANRENGEQLGKAVSFLEKSKGISFDQALKEVMQLQSTPEIVAYDKALKEVGDKIRPMKPQSSEECAQLIKLQREYESIGKDKIQFILNKVTVQQQ